jgi:dipeptidase
MCDTQILRKNKVTYFAKNSDREPNEMQLVVRIPPTENDNSPTVKTTYLEIPQTKKRFGVLLSKPSWTWGAEMGVNDQGVVIGNQALFTKVQEKQVGLIGLDLLRLGLERGSNAEEAKFVIIELLEKYGQGGICGYNDKTFSYDTSYIIADKNSAWVLETANRHWVAKKVDNFAAISNCITIGSDFDEQSKGLQDFARKQGLYTSGEFHFNQVFSSWFLTYFSKAKERFQTSCALLNNLANLPTLEVKNLIDNLRTHTSSNTGHFSRHNGDICMHACGFVRRSQTCGSMVLELKENSINCFFTGTSAPCLSIFKPANFNYNINFEVISQASDNLTLWQKHELIHRYFLFNKDARRAFLESRNKVESEMLEIIQQPILQDKDLERANKAISDWQKYWYQWVSEKHLSYPISLYGNFWKKLDYKILASSKA